ncbi:hypothetical protein DAMA08_017880 [Martiniozyma asiatica (nom. inval.)]|nr:hypothetical protein DAMA08_017880 [Martiniozyma asiatica]
MSKSHNIEILTFKDVKKAARTLYESFDDDDVARYCSRHLENDPQRKLDVDLAMYEAYVSVHIMKGLAIGIKGENASDADNETFETVALWEIPNGGDMSDYITLIRSGFAKLAWKTGAEGRKRIFQTMFPVLHGNFHDIMHNKGEENTFTLVYLGSTPKARGKGNVRAIFEWMFQNYIDKNNSVAYLESSSVNNFPIYEKFGFKPVADIWLGDKNDPVDSARMDVMIRGPNGSTWEYLEETRIRREYTIPKECSEYVSN